MGRTILAAVALLSVTALAGSATASPGNADGHFDRPQRGFAPSGTVLRDGSPADVGLDPAPIDAALQQIAAWTERTPGREHPMYAGAVSLLVHDGVVVRRDAVGHEVRYSDGKGTELPADQREPMQVDTIFDVASISKLFTSIAALQLVDDGAVRLDAPVAEYVPEFGVNGKQSITVEQLLTHTSGLQAEAQLWKLPPEQRIPSIMQLTPEHPPGTNYTYSDPNMITLGVLVQRITGEPLDRVVAERITGPLGMRDTGYNPPAAELHRVAATEFQADPPRGMVRGEAHDENAWALGGVAGQAGVFSTADDLATLGQALLNGGTYAGNRILSEDGVARMLTDFNGEFPGNAHGLGFELDQRWYMAGLSAPHTAGHTGYTGTSLVIDPLSRSVVVLLTNRVHPSRQWGSNNQARQALAQGMARALAVRPEFGSESWSADRAGTLTTDPLGPVSGPVQVTYSAFVDTQRDSDGVDPLLLESSVDGTTWRPVAVRAAGPGAPEGTQEQLAGSGHRNWWKVRGSVAAEPGEQVRLRWRYAPDGQYTGRGVNVDGILAADRDATLLDGELQADRLHPEGWVSTDR
ncbi:CubicO group peptidase, beta-lactamase class C family [Saccharopolyspora antimicrobica]|uniref:CubicO group peptidase (Beta-lactamase class C family) n=1 Tax=Saccharopolyspora antimicrobica TaxID=455193 RepID=A0A1I5FZY5_9PSEU|nr:serine hydrolase domain-containing protein [Saccharopolyspora antimicrobica]RKT83996.1 CubicO group peptidase (beta-lactamase class C family) [Saccharopolyspora antimicrobica]SFO29290.1 CubicO group peptidase, beta-lactamase class C family [Saccharopolyspora antimicrobica]